MKGGEECRAVRDIVAELRIEGLLGWPAPTDTKAKGGAAPALVEQEAVLGPPSRTDQPVAPPAEEREDGGRA